MFYIFIGLVIILASKYFFSRPHKISLIFYIYCFVGLFTYHLWFLAFIPLPSSGEQAQKKRDKKDVHLMSKSYRKLIHDTITIFV